MGLGAVCICRIQRPIGIGNKDIPDLAGTRRADFYWDLPAKEFQGLIRHSDGHTTHSNKALHFISRNINRFRHFTTLTARYMADEVCPR